MTYIHFVELLSLILHAKFQNHGPSGLEKIFKGFCYKQPRRPSWSCDLDHLYILYKLLFPLPKNAPHEVWLLLAKRFQRRSLNIMVICILPQGGGRPAPGVQVFFFQNHKSSVLLPISFKFFPSNDILTIFPIQIQLTWS